VLRRHRQSGPRSLETNSLSREGSKFWASYRRPTGSLAALGSADQLPDLLSERGQVGEGLGEDPDGPQGQQLVGGVTPQGDTLRLAFHGGGKQEVPLPEAVRQFLTAFNRRAYPQLELPEGSV